ncbi:hypothetical protein FB45DRAFT_1030991 [Roridomyces roridus]|uniref:DUF6533 domain-containing protein n=1 Tax=Roridomyces roridus TaxID=1738132 RepID=A0AAD7BM46_9AGAR|nr:hypothetical protein FB45DRAFT_1030991 [Roridomyces roridus]
MTPADASQDASGLLLLDYLHLLGITILFWDHIITLDNEIKSLWTRRGKHSLSGYWFFVNRTFAFTTGVAVAGFPFFGFGYETCRNYSLFREFALVVSQAITGVIMIVRVYALYGRDKRILWFLLGVGGCVVGVSVWSATAGQTGSRAELEGGCHFDLNTAAAHRLAGSWESLFAFDLLVFGMTLRIARKQSLAGMNLHRLIVRDGALYFGIIALANLVNIMTYYVDSQSIRPASLTTFANCMSATMTSRLLLNLHEEADTGVLTLPPDQTDTSIAFATVEQGAEEEV